MADFSDSLTASDTSMDIAVSEEFAGNVQSESEWSDFNDAVENEEAQMKKNISKLVLCSKHKQGRMLYTCPSCSAALALITDKRIISFTTHTNIFCRIWR